MIFCVFCRDDGPLIGDTINDYEDEWLVLIIMLRTHVRRDLERAPADRAHDFSAWQKRRTYRLQLSHRGRVTARRSLQRSARRTVERFVGDPDFAT